jgi:hypothetical protein
MTDLFHKTIFVLIYTTVDIIAFNSGYTARGVINAEKSFMKSAIGVIFTKRFKNI